MHYKVIGMDKQLSSRLFDLHTKVIQSFLKHFSSPESTSLISSPQKNTLLQLEINLVKVILKNPLPEKQNSLAYKWLLALTTKASKLIDDLPGTVYVSPSNIVQDYSGVIETTFYHLNNFLSHFDPTGSVKFEIIRNKSSQEQEFVLHKALAEAALSVFVPDKAITEAISVSQNNVLGIRQFQEYKELALYYLDRLPE